MEQFKTLTLATLILATPALAMANITVGDTLGTDEAVIRAAMEAQGYVVREIEFEHGKIEVEVYKDGVETELTLSAANGVITGIELENDSRDDD